MECHPIVENENEAICQEYVRSAIGLKPGCVLGPREQMNFATAFLDGSGIYGSTPTSSEDLRLLKGIFHRIILNIKLWFQCKIVVFNKLIICNIHAFFRNRWPSAHGP